MHFVPCLSLIRACEKEHQSKRQYRQSATLIQLEHQALLLELQCLQEKNAVLVSCIQKLSADGDPHFEFFREEQPERTTQAEAFNTETDNASTESREIAQFAKYN
jgi:hypothetical protein